MGHPALQVGMTEEEYLAFERASTEKHEYSGGEIFAMSGGTSDHAAVAANILRELGNALFGRGCRVHTSDMRVHIPETGKFVYPDASIVCGRPEFKDERQDTLTNPVLVVEVLSESTEAYDRGDKFAAYQTIPSLRHYVIAAQNKPRIEVYTRQADGGWLFFAYGAGEKATLSALECVVDVDRVYTDVLEGV